MRCHGLTAISSDVESLKKGIIKTSVNQFQARYTIVLLGDTGVGKSTFVEFIANVLLGNTIDRYDFDILDRNNEQNGSSNQSRTNSARLYKVRAKNGMVVWAGVLTIVSICNLLPRFASSIHRGWPILAVFSKTRCTRRVSLLRFTSISTPSPPSSYLLMALFRGLPSIPTMQL